MGLAHGQHFEAPHILEMLSLNRIGIEAAESIIRKRWSDQLQGRDVPDLMWRVEAVRYSGCSIDQWGGENYYTTAPRLELFSFAVKQETPCGVTIVHNGYKWCDLRPHAKQWASRTPAEALQQFADRRHRQLYILNRQLARAQEELSLAE